MHLVMYAQHLSLESQTRVAWASSDASVDTTLTDKFGIRSFPTIKIFKGGSTAHTNYRGERKASALRAHMLSLLD